jgi:hypothetical protein
MPSGSARTGSALLRVIKETLLQMVHEMTEEEGVWPHGAVMGFDAYQFVPTNAAALGDFRHKFINL